MLLLVACILTLLFSCLNIVIISISTKLITIFDVKDVTTIDTTTNLVTVNISLFIISCIIMLILLIFGSEKDIETITFRFSNMNNVPLFILLILISTKFYPELQKQLDNNEYENAISSAQIITIMYIIFVILFSIVSLFIFNFIIIKYELYAYYKQQRNYIPII